MKVSYLALFTQIEDCVLVEVPDLEILTEGKDLNDAVNMAKDAIALQCVYREDKNEKNPKPSNSINVKDGTFSNLGVTIVDYVSVDICTYREKMQNGAN